MSSTLAQSSSNCDVDDCPICLAPLSTGNQLLSAVCRHGVHVHCAMGNAVALTFFMRNNVCSICRKGPFLAEATLQSTSAWMQGGGEASPFPSTPRTPRWHHPPSPYPADAFHVAGEWGPDELDELEEYQAAAYGASQERSHDTDHASPPVSVWAYEAYEEDAVQFHEEDSFQEWAAGHHQQFLDELELREAYYRAHEEGPSEYEDSRSIGDTDIRNLDVDEDGLPFEEQLEPEAPRSVSQGPGYSSEQLDSDGDPGGQRSMEGEAGHDPSCERYARVRREIQRSESEGLAYSEATNENHLTWREHSNRADSGGLSNHAEDREPSHEGWLEGRHSHLSDIRQRLAEQVQNLEEVRQRARQIREWQAQEPEQEHEHSEGRHDEHDYEDEAVEEEEEEEPRSRDYVASNSNSPYGYTSASRQEDIPGGGRVNMGSWEREYGRREYTLPSWDVEPVRTSASPPMSSRGYDSEPLEPPIPSPSPPSYSHDWVLESPEHASPNSHGWEFDPPEHASPSPTPQPDWDPEPVYPFSPSPSQPEPQWEPEPPSPDSSGYSLSPDERCGD